MTKQLLFRVYQQHKKIFLLLSALTAGTTLLLLAICWLLAQLMQSAGQGETSLSETAPIFLVLFLSFTAKSLLNFVQQQKERQLSERIRDDVRTRLHQLLFAQQITLEPGRLLTLCTETTDALDAYFTTVLPEILSCLIAVPIILLAGLYYDPLTALLYLITLPIAPFLLYLIGRVTKTASEAQWQRLLQLTNGFYETLHGMVTLKIFRQTERQYQRFCQLSEDFSTASLKVLQIAFVSTFALELITTLSIAIIAVSIGLRLLAGNLSFPTAFFLLLITPEFYQPLRNGGLSFHAYMTAHTAENELQRFLAQAKTEIKETSLTHISKNNSNIAIRCQNVNFRYPQTNANVIADFSLDIPYQQVTILCGESGSGKSTLLKLLAGILTPIDGHIESAPHSTISYVPQQPHLFAATLRDNISLFFATTDAAVEHALRLANLSEWMQTLLQGLDTKLGEGGLTLSRGQLQRLGLARAFLQNRNIVLLDEPTAGLDRQTEQQVLTALTKFAQGRTLIIASHRPAVISWGDKIVTITPPIAKEVL